jgi:hypothetical protein
VLEQYPKSKHSRQTRSQSFLIISLFVLLQAHCKLLRQTNKDNKNIMSKKNGADDKEGGSGNLINRTEEHETMDASLDDDRAGTEEIPPPPAPSSNAAVSLPAYAIPSGSVVNPKNTLVSFVDEREFQQPITARPEATKARATTFAAAAAPAPVLPSGNCINAKNTLQTILDDSAPIKKRQVH